MSLILNDILFEYELAIVTAIRNEARYISEWLEYHYRIGVDKFFIYDVESTDRSELEQILQPWIEAGVVEYHDETKLGEHLVTVNQVAFEHRCDCRYLCMLSVHEFIFYKGEGTLLEYLHSLFSENDIYSALAINRVYFGSSGEKFYKPGSVVERFTYRTPKDFPFNEKVTSIMNPRRIRSVEHDSFGLYYAPSCAVDSAYHLVKWESSPERETSLIQVNSYYTKSRQEFDEMDAIEQPNYFRYRDDNLFDAMSKDNFIETDFRDFFRKVMQKPMPSVHLTGERLVFENVIKMREPFANVNASDDLFEGQAEKFMTCFLLSQRRFKQVDEKKRRAVEIFALQSLYKSMTLPKFQPWTMVWLVDSLPEFLQSQSEQALKIILGIKRSIGELITMVDDYGRDFEDAGDLIERKRLLDVLFEREI